MTTTTPPRETMQSLRALISPDLSGAPSEVAQLVRDHKAELLSHIHRPRAASPATIRYRHGHATTLSHPEPTPAETLWLSSHKLPLPRHVAALHLRDYIHATFPTTAHRILRSANLVPFAPPQQVLQFARLETRAAFSALSHILTHPRQFPQFLQSHRADVRATVLAAAAALLSPADPQKPPLITPDPPAVAGLLLTATFSDLLSLSDITPLVDAYNAAAPHPPHALQADPLALHLLTAAFTTAVRRASQLSPHTESFRPLLADNSILPTLVSLSLASALRLNHRPQPPPNHPSSEFMEHALSSDALGKLRLLLQYPLPATYPNPVMLMFRAFTDDLLAFLSAFPPTSLDHSQIDDLSALVSALMARSQPAPLALIANSLWDDGDKSPLAKGLESVLHLSSALYPLSFRPLIVLLRVLAVDKRSAAHAVNYLEHRMSTICESAKVYADALIALDEDDDVIWDRLRDYSRDYRATRALTDVKMGGSMVFVQAMRDIPGGTYRAALPAGAVGVSDENFTTVAWVHPWNGFAAVVYALDTLHDILCTDVPPSPDFHPVLEDLVDSAIEALGFVQQVCLNGSHTLRDHFREGFGIVETIARIVAEVLQMKGKANFSFEWLQALLRSASSCLPAIVGEDIKVASRVASILSDAVKQENFTAVLSSFGEIVRSVLGALACIHSVVSDEIFQANSACTMMYSKCSDEGVDVFMEVITNILCSGSLVNGSIAMPLDHQSSTGWLLPLWSMRLFQSRPDVLLSSSSGAVLFATIILSTASRRHLSEPDSFLYPAVCEAIIACANALRHRSKGLACLQRSDAKHQDTSNDCKANKLTALEEVLLRPDIVEAMAMICCGGAKRLQDDKLYSSWSDSKERYLLPVRGGIEGYKRYDMLLSYISHRETTADLWVSSMATRCLSLQMDCLSHFESPQGIPQVPWPSSSCTHDTNECLGAVVRERIAKRISKGHGSDLLGLLAAILSCRQRAASRSLFGPRRSSFSDSDLPNCTANDSRRKTEQSNAAEPKQERAPEDPIPAVIFCLRHTFQDYKKLLLAHTTNGSKEKFQFLKRGGQLSTMTAACIRMLRLGFVSQNSRWFRDYTESDFWELLISLVRCRAGSEESNSFDLKRTTQDWYACANMSGMSKNSGLDSHCLVINAELVLDIASVWKGIAADVFRIASREILAEATESLFTNRKDESESDYGLDESLFRKRLFRSFATTFSETWVTALLGTEQVRQAIDRPGLATESQDAKRLKAAPTLKQLARRLSTRIMEKTAGTPTNYDILSKFDRSGDLAVPYGASYAFDVAGLRQFLIAKRVSETLRDDIILAVMDLNKTISCQDVYVEVLSSFSSMASVVLFVDSLCPTRNLRLSYSSPQFGGKLCRYLPSVLTSLLPGGALSWHFVAVSLEVSKLLSMLSTRLTKEELEQGALTSMGHDDSLEVPAELNGSTPLGHICHVISCIVSTENTAIWSREESRSRHEIISWLLLTASRYTKGSAFHSTADLQSLVRSCVRTLKMVNGTSDIWAAVSTALTETIANIPDDLFLATFTNGVFTVLLSAVDAAANKCSVSDERPRGKAIAGLLLTLTRVVIRLRNVGNNDNLVSLREINASGVQPLLPAKGKPTETYDLEHDERNVSHILWCSVLQLAAVAIPGQRDPGDTDMIGRDDMRNLLEFCSMHLERIVDDSLDLQSRRSEGLDSYSRHGRLNFQAVTLGKVEEAEVSAALLSRLSPFGLVLQNAMPNTTRRAVEQLCRYTAQATRILRTDPVERWVRPITQRERERSGVAMEQLTSVVGALPNGQSTPNMSPSPGRRSRSQLTPKRSPSQALRAALSGKSRQGLTPSPGASLTPLLSPMPSAKETQRTPPYFSPNSTWGHHGSGLITRTGGCFAEEVSMSLIRGLCAALVGIRQLSDHLGIYPFQPTMEPVGDAPGIGTLLAILKFARLELNREGGEDRKAYVQGIADTAMHLTLSHAMTHAETGALPQSVRDEVRKRVTTTLYRANNLVPPIPTSSILRDEGLMSLWKRF